MHRICLPLVLLLALVTSFMPESERAREQEREDEKHLHITSQTVSTQLRSVDGSPLGTFHLQTVEPEAIQQVSNRELGLLVHSNEHAINFEPLIQEKLFRYLSAPKSTRPFDCLQFVYQFLQGHQRDSAQFSAHDWDLRLFDGEQNIAAGEVVGLTQGRAGIPEHSLSHVAVKLYDNLYLSKAGLKADFLLISDLQTMIKLWKSSAITTMRLL